MIGVVVWEIVILSQLGFFVPWQRYFLSGNIGAGDCFGHSGPQHIILPSLILVFFNSYLDQGFSGILQNEADMQTYV
jgi:hypothetical protein